MTIYDKIREPEATDGIQPSSVAPRRTIYDAIRGADAKAALLPAATSPAGPAPAQAVASAPVIPSDQASPVAAAPLPQAQPAAPPSPRFGQPGYNPLLHGGDSKPPLDLRIKRALGMVDSRDAGPPMADGNAAPWYMAHDFPQAPKPADTRTAMEKVADWTTKDTYVGQQALSLATLALDFIPATLRGVRGNAKMFLEAAFGEDKAQKIRKYTKYAPFIGGITGEFEDADKFLDASGNLRAEAKAWLMESAKEQGGMTGAVIAGVSEGIADTILALKTMQALKVGYGQEAVKAGAPWFAKSWSVVKSAAVRAGIMTARTPHDNPKEFAKAYGLSLAYQSTPAISRHFKDTASVIAADIALNSGITATQVKGLIDSAWAQAEAEGGAPEQVERNAAIYATISMIQTIGSDIVFGAMTRAFKDAPPPVRDALEHAKAQAAKVGNDLPTAKPMPVPVDDSVRGPETNPVLATPERPVLISNQPEAARSEEGERISAPEEPAARVNPLLEPERVAQPAAQAERPAEPQAEAARPAEQVAAPEAARPPIEQARDEAGAPDVAPREATSRLDESKHPTVELPIERLKLSADVPNFKEGASETGEVEPLQGRYERLGTPPVVVWERTNGDREIITGRHRWNLAKRSGEKTIPAQVVREADGFTKDDAAIFDAESNIRDGQGSVKDYANFFKKRGISREEASSSGLLSREKGRDGYEIGTSASDDLYALFAAGKISPRKAAAIAKQAPGQPEAQKLGMDYAEKHNAEQTEQYMRAVVSMAPKSSDKQLDLLGWDDSWQIQADKMGRAASDIRGELSAERTSLKHALSLTGKRQAEVVKKYGFKTGDKDAIKDRVGELERELISWGNWNLDAELTATVRERAGLPPVEKPAASDSFKLESAIKAELDAEAKRLADKAKLDDMAIAPLEGRPDADIGQSRLPGTGGEIDLFNAPKQTAEAAPRTAADLAKPAQEPARVAEPAQEPAMEKPTAPLAKAVAEAPQAFRVTSSRGNVHNVKMPDGTTYPIRAESKAEAVAKAQEIAAKAKPLSEMNDADLRERADELGVPYDPKSTAKELRARIRAAQQGGFIDVSPRAPSKDDPPFVRQMKENDRRVHEWQKRHTRDAISALRSEVVDRQADVKRALKGIGANDAIRRLVLRQGSGAEAARQFRVAEKSIADVLPTRDRELFKYYLQAMRVVEATQVQAERGIELKSPMSAEDAKRFLNDDFVKLPQEQQDAVMGAAKKYWGVMREQLDALYAEGLIGKEGYEAIATKHRFYSPRRFVEFIDPQTIKPKGEMRHDSGVDALDKGSESAMAADPMYLMAHVITRTQNRLFRNRANKALYDTAIASPENSVARVLGEKENPNRTEGSVSVFIDGKEVRMAMPKELAAEWDGLPPALSRNMAAFLQWASGTKVLKTLATGANPEFAISNLPRDAMYAWFISGQYSSVLPKAIGQILLDYKRSMRDAIKRTGAYTDYVKEGGGMDFLTTQGMTRKPGIEGGHRLARKIGDILAWAGETSEIATRLAVRNRAIRNGLSPEEATYVARNMLDFSQGGTFAKAADNVIPYLNAAIQGTRGGFRAFKENPKVASFKAAQLAAMGYALAQVAATFTPELWDSINAREKASKWIIPLSWTRKDKEGNDRHAYIAIPKDQFQQVFAAIGQSFVDGVRGNPWKPQIVDSLFSTIPVEASSTIPPIMNAALAYYGNYDTWTKENVWQGYEDISPSKEQSWQTPEIAVDIAELASRIGVEISPERLATATGKVVPTSNPLGSIMSSIYATGNPDPELGRTIVEKLRDIPGIRRVLRFSRPSNLQKFTMDKAYQYNVDVAGMTDLQAREAIKVAERKRADVRYPLNIEADKIARQAVRGDVSSDNLQKWIDSVPQEERKRVESRIKAQYKKSWKSPSEIIRVITDPGATSDLSKQANAEWLAKYGMDGMTAKDLRTALVKEAREQGWNREMYDSKGKLTAYGQRKLRLSRFIRKHNIE